MNVNPEDRISEIGFTSLDEALNLEAILTVKQKSAPLIEDSRSGDSLALMIIQKKIDTYTEFDTGESMVNWYGVKLWERTDKDVTPEMIGRVRSAEFFIYETDDELPAEISKLKYIETLYFSGNINKDRKDLHIGSCLNDLKHLKYLTVTGHGLVELPSELEIGRAHV